MPEPEPFYFESKSGFESCCDGGRIVVLGSAESPSPWKIKQALGYCLRCEHWSWATTLQLDRAWNQPIQAGMYMQHLRAEVLAQLY